MKPAPARILRLALFFSALAVSRAADLGLFTDQGDVGASSRPGTGSFDAAQGAYTVGASGANMWFKSDAMHFVWRKVSGDASIAADISFVGSSKQGHRKACLVIRQDLDPG